MSHESEKLALSTTEQPKLSYIYVCQCNPMQQLVDLQLSVVKAGYSRKCMFLRPTLHPSIFLVVGCNGAILVSQVPMMTLLAVYTDE